MKRFILYHASCADGLGSAAVAFKKFGEDAVYCPVQYKKPMPDELLRLVGHNQLCLNKNLNIHNKDTVYFEVYILDFSYPRDQLLQLYNVPGLTKLVVLDHHKTAKEDLEGLIREEDLDPAVVDIQFDINRSGAMMSWDYFFPNQEPPFAIKLVQDRDLWRFEFGQKSKELHAALPFLKWKPDLFLKYMNDDVQLIDLMDKGEMILELNNQETDAAIKHAIIIQYNDHRVAFMNTTTHQSEIGEKLYKKLPVDYSMTYFVLASGEAVLSFRSQGETDVGAIAKSLGGGGHKNSSGAIVPLSQIEEFYKMKVPQ